MSVLLSLHLTHMRAAGLSPSTIADRKRLLETADRQLPYGIDTASTEELTEFLSNPDWAAWTRVTYHRHIAGFYRWAAAGDHPYITFDPAAELRRPRSPHGEPHPATDEQLRLALERSNWRWRLAITLAAYAGLRASEISRIKREHIQQDTLTVWHGKGDKTATLPTHPEVWRLAESRPSGLLIPNPWGKPMAFKNSGNGHFRRIDLNGLHLHMFRHWFATMLLRQGTDIRTVQSLMRHENLQTTAGYLLIADEQRRFAVSTLPIHSSSPHQEAA